MRASPSTSSNPSSIDRRARRKWAVAAIGSFLARPPLPAELEPIGRHEARHTYASLMIAAGREVKTLGAYLALLDHHHAR